MELTGLALSPSIGYRLSDRLSLGVGVSALYTNFEETIAINNNFVPGPVMVCDSKVKLENMDDWSWQFELLPPGERRRPDCFAVSL